MIELVTFLGNPGGEYARNRHNAGWLFAAQLPFYSSLDWRKKYQGNYAALDGEKLKTFNGDSSAGMPSRLHFLKPETFMNSSGDAIHAAASFFKIPAERILLVHDELELPLGTVSLKFSGGLGGHNGLRSMKARFNTADFWRLRIGIGRPDDRKSGQGGPAGSGKGILEWVLSDFSREEEAVLAEVFIPTTAMLTVALAEGPEKYLPGWAKKKIITE
ncbi:peptidyl-tRNA hydrolase [Spirochaetia bacterium]|nr:peptidyl-tRNA hydrolase [Spirochaetia bacterium]